MKLFFILLSGFCWAQNAEIIYNFKVLKDEKIVKSKYIGDIHLQTIRGAEKLNFLLQTNDSISKFSLIPVMDIDQNSDVNLAVLLSGSAKPIFTYDGKVWRNNTSGMFREDTFLIVDPMQTNWELTSETKEIDGYLCYKATSEYIVINGRGEFHHPLIAWYCPQIPIPLGPKGYGKLPGLILELQEWNSVFGLVKINLNTTNEPLELPKKGKVISNQEFQNKVGKKFMKQFDE
ncbi:GLPGLI family protein [Flavobacterium sp. U410]|jgi:GLPGLI family protein